MSFRNPPFFTLNFSLLTFVSRTLLLAMAWAVTLLPTALAGDASQKTSSKTSDLETRLYLVDGERFWNCFQPIVTSPTAFKLPIQGTDEELSREVTEFLQDAGFPFTQGTFLRLDRRNSTVTIYNTRSQLDQIEKLLGPMSGKGNFYIERRIIQHKKK